MVDGRHLRRAQNRDAAIEALVTLYEEGRYDPSAAEIAERAGLSPRSLFRYFDDTDDLARAAVAYHLALVQPLLSVAVAPDDPLDRRIDELVRRRVELWEAIMPSARVARMRAPVVPVLAEELRRNRAYLRRQIGRVLPELGKQALAAADVLCSFESYELLRNDQRLSAKAVRDVIAGGLRGLLA